MGEQGDFFLQNLQAFGSAHNATCPAAKWQISDTYSIQSLPLIPLCIIALLIGVYCSKQLRKHAQFEAQWMYQTVFFLYGIMMTSAMILHCFTPAPTSASSRDYIFFYSFIVVVDLGLTSNIAVGFMWSGLADLKIVDANSAFAHWGFIGSYVCVFIAWIYIVIAQSFYKGFLIMYIGVVGICCLVYCITQLVWLSKQDREDNHKALWVLLGSGVAGAIGLASISVLSEPICRFLQSVAPELAPWLAGQTWWYILSDVAMFGLWYYIYITREQIGYETLPQDEHHDSSELETTHPQQQIQQEYQDTSRNNGTSVAMRSSTITSIASNNKRYLTIIATIFSLGLLLLICTHFQILSLTKGNWSNWKAGPSDHWLCERQINAVMLVQQPMNSWSSMIFIVVGTLALILTAHNLNNESDKQNSYWLYSLIYGVSLLLLGVASVFYHASLTLVGLVLDSICMYIIACWATSYNIHRVNRKEVSSLAFFILYVAQISCFGLIHVYSSNTYRYVALLVSKLVFIVSQIIVDRATQQAFNYTYWYIAIGSMAAAWGAALLDNEKNWCEPTATIQWHAVGHLLDGLAACMLYLFYTSEKRIKSSRPL